MLNKMMRKKGIQQEDENEYTEGEDDKLQSKRNYIN